MLHLHLPGEADTHALGVRLGRALFPQAVLALVGDLGAGKTALVRGIAEGLEIPSRVQSPTFVLVVPHEGGRLPLWHVDLYRLSSLEEIVDLGLRELAGDGVLAIEWADRAPDELPADHLRIELSGLQGREVTVTATGPRHEALEAACAR
jgi:tRNA threonylcarbamoyladenosine biosynthesis protein TsaE